MKKRYVLLLTILTPFFMMGQDSDLGSWYLYLGNKKLNNQWNLHHEIQYRNYDGIGDLEQLLLRTGIGYNLSDNNNNVLLGYGYILSENYMEDATEKQSVNEHRIFQQFQTKHGLGLFNVKHRFRFEQRFVEKDFKSRLRYFLSLSIPITNKLMENNTLYASLYNEIFLNTTSEMFDRNRLYGGIGYKINDVIKLELGYMNQFFESSSRDQINTIMYINF